MRPPEQSDDGDFELMPLDTPPARLPFAPRVALGRRGRVALAICAIALAILAPLVTLTSTRAAIVGLFPTPTATSESNASLTIISVATTQTDIAPARWDTLRARPLLLPILAPGAGCPAAQGQNVAPGFGPAIGDTPVYIVGMGSDGVLHATAPATKGSGGATWGGQFAMFIIAPNYRGPVLARGHQLDGPHALLFNGGLDQLTGFDPTSPVLLSQLRIEGSPSFGSPWANFPTQLRVQAPGCYAIQLDGETFSQTVVFRVVFGN